MSWKKIRSEVVHQNPFWVYRHDTFEIPQSKRLGEYYYVETSGSVMVVPVLKDGRLGLIQTYRCLLNKQSFEFPGGAVNQGQNFEQAARAELLEEAGLEAEELINVGEFCPFNGITTEKCRVFLARDLRPATAEKNPQEPIELAPRRLDEIEEMIKRNEIWDGQTLAVWAVVRPYFN